PRDGRLLHREIAEGPVGAMLGIERGVAEPDIQHGVLRLLDVAADPDLEALGRIIGADAHVVAEVLPRLAALAHHVDDDALAHRLLAGRTAEGVFDLRPVLAVVTPETAR